MSEFTLEEYRLLKTAIEKETSTSDERSMMQNSLLDQLNNKISHLEELDAFAGECEGGACKL